LGTRPAGHRIGHHAHVPDSAHLVVIEIVPDTDFAVPLRDSVICLMVPDDVRAEQTYQPLQGRPRHRRQAPKQVDLCTPELW
jgi:hypothetical protein